MFEEQQTQSSDAAYFKRREAQSRSAAKASHDDSARVAHQRLASLYAERLSRLSETAAEA